VNVTGLNWNRAPYWGDTDKWWTLVETPWSWPAYLMCRGSQCHGHLRWLRKRKLKAEDNMAIMAMLSALTRPRPLEEEGRVKTRQWCWEKRTQPVRVFNVTMFSGKRKPEWSLLVMRRICARLIARQIRFNWFNFKTLQEMELMTMWGY